MKDTNIKSLYTGLDKENISELTKKWIEDNVSNRFKYTLRFESSKIIRDNPKNLINKLGDLIFGFFPKLVEDIGKIAYNRLINQRKELF